MNNLKNLYPCLNSIKEQTHRVTYETLVVAYLFSEDNLQQVKKDFPWVTFIVSNEIRGFSENNNLALKRAEGKYCFVLNDDTEMKMPVVDMLVESIDALPKDVAVISPRSIYGNGKPQSCGRPKHTLSTYVMSVLKLWHEQKNKSIYVNQKGVFQTYDIWGAFFLIKTDVFREMGWFDERYFFSPEDIALSRKLNRGGYKCYVNSDIVITHYEGMTGKGANRLQTATKPASFKGNLIYYGDNSQLKYVFVSLLLSILLIPTFLYHLMNSFLFGNNRKGHKILAKSCINCMKVCFSKLTPKQVFIKYSKDLI